jgi:electron transfer flavoprotein alpha subunit
LLFEKKIDVMKTSIVLFADTPAMPKLAAEINLLLFTSDGLGAELATRLSYRLKGSSCLMVETLKINSGNIEVTKSAYNNYMVAGYTMDCFPYCLSAAKNPCQPAENMKKELLVFELDELDQLKPDWVKSFTIVPDDSHPSGLVHQK